MELRALDVCLQSLDRAIDKSKLVIAQPVTATGLTQTDVFAPSVADLLQASTGNERQIIRKEEFIMDECCIAIPVEVSLYGRTIRDMILPVLVIAKIKANCKLVPEPGDIAFVHIPRRDTKTVIVIFIVRITRCRFVDSMAVLM